MVLTLTNILPVVAACYSLKLLAAVFAAALASQPKQIGKGKHVEDHVQEVKRRTGNFNEAGVL